MAAALLAAGTVPIIAPPGVFKGRELTRKDRRLSASLEPINALLEGGIPRGRISEIIGRRSCGKTSLAAAFISSATRRGEVAAVIDLANAFDPSTMAEAGVELSRVLWIQPGNATAQSFLSPLPQSVVGEGEGEGSDTLQVLPQLFQTAFPNRRRSALNGAARSFLRAAEMVLEAGGFGLLVMDFGESAFTLAQSSALRLARMAERSGTAVLILASRPLCGTFAAMNLELTPAQAIFSRNQFGQTLVRRNRQRSDKSKQYLKCIRHPHPLPLPRKIVGEGRSKALFEGIEIRATVRRNKLGRCGLSAQWRSMVSIADSANHQAIRIA
jgi:RecA DNA recombination protein